jgi:kynurenine formamidase
MRRHIDLSHRVEAGMVTYPGLPAPVISDHLSREDSRRHYGPGVTFQIGRIELISNTGTYVDAPWHRWADGPDLAGLPLDRLADVPGVVVEAPGPTLTASDLAAVAVAGRAVLVRTGWDRHWRTGRYGEPAAPHLDEGAARWLVEQGAAIVGIDSLNIDDVTDPARPVHSVLLAAGIPVVEHLTNLAELTGVGAFRFSAVPVAVVGMGTFPVRAYAIVD